MKRVFVGMAGIGALVVSANASAAFRYVNCKQSAHASSSDAALKVCDVPDTSMLPKANTFTYSYAEFYVGLAGYWGSAQGCVRPAGVLGEFCSAWSYTATTGGYQTCPISSYYWQADNARDYGVLHTWVPSTDVTKVEFKGWYGAG